MAILNLTPDSFYDGGRYGNEKEILERVEAITSEGAAFVDIGGYSTRPGASEIPEEEELKRILPTIETIAKRFPDLLISVDTFRASVANAALNSGASIINDVSGGSLDPNMIPLVARTKAPYVMMHMKGDPQTMNSLASYNDVTKEVVEFFHQRVHQLASLGINDILVDPGFGFAKTREHNFELLSKLETLRLLDRPIVAGLSRKSMVWKTLGVTPQEALNGTTTLNTIALMKGIHVLRVHDVREAAQVIALVTAMNSRS